MRIRPAQRADLPRILAIYNHEVLCSTATADEEPQTLVARTRWFDDHAAQGLPVLVAEAGGGEDGGVVGFAALNRFHTRPGYRYTVDDSVYVADSHRGHGVGKLLLEALLVEVPRRGYHSVIAVITSDNGASLRLHERAGFTPAGRLANAVFKLGRWVDVIYLQRSFALPATASTSQEQLLPGLVAVAQRGG